MHRPSAVAAVIAFVSAPVIASGSAPAIAFGGALVATGTPARAQQRAQQRAHGARGGERDAQERAQHPQDADPPPRVPVAETDRFTFFADPDINLHHLLYHWARAENGQALTTVEERAEIEELSDEDRATWSEAVRLYWRRAGTRHVLFDDGMVALRDAIASRGGVDGLEERDRRLYEALTLARPVYERHWSDTHRHRNVAWIDALLEDLPAVEARVGDAIAEAYQGAWPDRPIPVDVSPYTNRVGGYTTSDFHITISSTDSANVMPQALELLFHEASHGETLESGVHGMLGEAFGALGDDPPGELWHTVLFFTAGETVEIAYEALGRPGYRHYGEVTGLYRRGAERTRESAALAEHWRPFLRGRVDRETALRDLAVALTSSR